MNLHSEDLRFPSYAPSGLYRSAHGHGRSPTIAATLYIPASATPGSELLPGLVVGHGAGSNRARHAGFARIACGQGMAVLVLDFRGHGESSGSVDGPLEHDLYAAIELLSSHPLVDSRRIGYRGSSMGGFYGLQAAAGMPLAALALLCPATETILLRALDESRSDRELERRDDLEARFDEEALRTYLETRDTLSAAEAISSPVFLAHARGDEVVPVDTSFAIASRLQGGVEMVVVPGGNHGTVQASNALHERTSLWLAEHLRNPLATSG